MAWFILKCTLEYPQRFAGKTHQLPALNLHETPDLGNGNLADHVRLWGQWVLENARGKLQTYYPVIDCKPAVAYLWARTIPCQDPSCGGTIPLLKTLWVCTKAERTLRDTPENRRRCDFRRIKETRNTTKVIINAKRALKLKPNFETKRVDFEIVAPNGADDVEEPTMSGSTATCPFCRSQQPVVYIKRCGQEGKLRAQMTTVVYQENYGKEYRLPRPEELKAAEVSEETLGEIADYIPHGIPDEPLPTKERHRAVGSQLPDYGFKNWSHLFTNRQLLTLMTFVQWTRTARFEMQRRNYSAEWVNAVEVYLAILLNRLAGYESTLCIWETHATEVKHTFGRFALPMTWDFAEGNPLSNYNRYYKGAIEYVARFLSRTSSGLQPGNLCPKLLNIPARMLGREPTSVIITDPPYYDAIPYADLSDFYYVWLRRSIGDRFQSGFGNPLTPKSEELIQQHKTGDRGRDGKQFYENGMSESFRAAYESLCDDGRMVIVFAHKDPEAWETLTTAMIDARLVVTASWPIDTEMAHLPRATDSASLATSLWIVCRKRPENAREGRYAQVKREMEKRVAKRLRDFWDAGIQGPDFVWAAIGPALESYSRFDAVKRQTGEVFSVHEFLTEVRHMVTDFALGQILHGASTAALDEWTRYYLMHMHHFGNGEAGAPVGECILLAQGYGISLNDLTSARIGILKKALSGSALRLLGHADRRSDRVGQPHATGGLPIIDMIHRITNLWEAGERAQINAYFAAHGLHENNLYRSVVQVLIEMSAPGSDERSLLETIINYRPSATASGGTSSPSVSDEDPQYRIEGMEP